MLGNTLQLQLSSVKSLVWVCVKMGCQKLLSATNHSLEHYIIWGHFNRSYLSLGILATIVQFFFVWSYVESDVFTFREWEQRRTDLLQNKQYVWSRRIWDENGGKKWNYGMWGRLLEKSPSAQQIRRTFIIHKANPIMWLQKYTHKPKPSHVPRHFVAMAIGWEGDEEEERVFVKVEVFSQALYHVEQMHKYRATLQSPLRLI